MNGNPFTKKEVEHLIHQCRLRKSRWTIIEDFYQKFKDTQHSTDSIQRKISRFQQDGIVNPRQVLESNLRIGCADIEATGLNCDFDYMFCYCIQDFNSNEKYEYCITPKEMFGGPVDREPDFNVVKYFLQDVQRFDVLYYHYGQDRCFDMPFIRGRMFANHLEKVYLNMMRETRIRDTWPIARNKLKLCNNRLITIAEHLDIQNVKKTPLTKKTWRLAQRGDQKSINYVLDHCQHDVQVLKEVVKKLQIVDKPKNIF